MSITFGRTSTTSSSAGLLTDYAYIERYELAVPMLAQRVKAYTSQGAVSGHFKGLIFEDDEGDPGDLIVAGGAVSLAGGSTKAWRSSNLASAESLEPGYYWIGIVVDTGYTNIHRDYTSSDSYYGENDYSSPDNWDGGTHYDARHLCVCVEGEPGSATPDAPTGLSPASGSINVLVSNTFSWVFGSSDPERTQGAFQIRWREAGTTLWTTRTQVVSPYSSTVIPGSTFGAVSLEWQVKACDDLGTEGPWSASAFVTGSEAATVVITSPAAFATVSAADEPLEWTATDQDSFEVQRLGDDEGEPDEATVYENSGTVSETDTLSYAFTLSATARWEHWQVRVTSGTVTTDWESIPVFVDYTPPATPTLDVTIDEEAGAMVLTVTNPTPGGGEPTVVAADYYMTEGDAEEIRIAANADPDEYIYRAPADGVVYGFRVEVIGDNGGRASNS